MAPATTPAYQPGGGPLRGLVTALVALVALLASVAEAQQPPSVNLYYTASTAAGPATSPVFYGVNSGHNIDAAWLSWAKHMGVNGMRIFGLAGNLSTPPAGFPAGPGTGLQGFVNGITNGQAFPTPAGSWGLDMSGNLVTNYNTWASAVNQLRQGFTSSRGGAHRRPANHNPPWPPLPNNPRWDYFNTIMSTSDFTQPTGLSIFAMIQALQSAAIEPLLVFWMGCPVFSFSTLDPQNQWYWAERWELYKHQYMAALWAFKHGVRKMEFWNEPDLNSNCITYYSWLEHYTLQSQAIQNAFADGNADVASGMISCPASISSCPLQPLIYASAFAQSTFATTQSTAAGAAVSPYKANYSADFYAYMGAETVQNERMPFPPYAFNNQPFTPSGAQWGGRTDLQNMNAFSLHSYGKTGFQMFQLGSQTAAQIAAVRPPLGPSSPAVIPYVVTEHAAHTTAQWNPIASTSDINYEASRLGTQILFHSLNGWEAFIFKFSMAEQSLAITPNCVQQTSPNFVAGTSVGCGVQKVGLHWAENAQFPFPIGDSTISVETARLILTAMVGGYTLETLSLPALAGPNPYLTALPQYNISAIAKYPPTAFPPIGVVNNGITRTLVWVNDGVNPGDNAWGASGSYPSLTQTVTVNINSWGLPLGTKLIHSVAAAGYMGEIYTWPLVVGGPNLTVTVPPFSTSTIIAPLTPQTETVLSATEDATLKAGVNQNTNFGAAPMLSVSTSVTSTHDSTSAAMIKFTIPAGLTQVVVAVLELTVMTPPTADMQMIIVGLDPTSSANGGPVSWADATVTWASAVNVFTGTPTSQITSIAQNFLQLASGNVIAGHVTVPANTPAGTKRRVDVTAFVRVAAAAYGNATFVLSRRWRNNAASGNAGGSIAADNLSLGAVTTFFSKESAAGGTGPALRLYTPTTALQLINQAPSSQLSLSSSIGLSGYTLDTFGPAQQSTFLAVASNQLSVPPSNIAIAGLAAPTASSRRALLQAGLNGSAVSINISITVNHPTPTGANALAGAISTGLTELTGPAGSPALVSSLQQAGLAHASGTALTVQPTVRSKNGSDVTSTINKFFSVLHLNLSLANDTAIINDLRDQKALLKEVVAPAAVGAVLICFCCVVAVFMSKIKRLNQEKLAALEAKAAELEDKHRAAEARVSSILTDQEQQSVRRMSFPQRQETVDRHLHRLASTVTFGLVAPPNDEESPEAYQPDWASKPRAGQSSSSRRGGGGQS